MLLGTTMAISLVLGSSQLVAADVGEVMGGNHQLPAQYYNANLNKDEIVYNQRNWAEDNQVMTTHQDYNHYDYQYPYYSDYYGNVLEYGYHDYNGDWHDYQDEWGYPMYYWNGSYYYY